MIKRLINNVKICYQWVFANDKFFSLNKLFQLHFSYYDQFRIIHSLNIKQVKIICLDLAVQVPTGLTASSISDLAHEEVDARVDLQVLQALHLALDAHQQAAEADVDSSEKGEAHAE